MSIRDDDFSREDRGRRALKDGEWACPDAKCAQVNAERITHCEGCGKYKPAAKSRVGKEIGKEMAEKSKGLFAAEDWVCSKCGNVNWARRKSCNVCNAPKLADLEKRTGYGGGYMDRQDVEYVKRDYDEEFDEFGRKKKRVSEGRGKNSPDGSDNEDDDEDDDGELIEENLSKYKLDDEAEDEEEDEDDEDDLGKYDLTADPDLIERKIETVKPKKIEESDCSCSCSGGECSCEESECEKEKEHDRGRDRGKVHKSSRERDRERDDRHRRRSQSKDRKRSRSRDRKRSRSRERRRSRSREKRRSRERRDRSRDRKRSRTRSRERKRDREERRRSRSRERRR